MVDRNLKKKKEKEDLGWTNRQGKKYEYIYVCCSLNDRQKKESDLYLN